MFKIPYIDKKNYVSRHGDLGPFAENDPFCIMFMSFCMNIVMEHKYKLWINTQFLDVMFLKLREHDFLVLMDTVTPILLSHKPM